MLPGELSAGVEIRRSPSPEENQDQHRQHERMDRQLKRVVKDTYHQVESHPTNTQPTRPVRASQHKHKAASRLAGGSQLPAPPLDG